MSHHESLVFQALYTQHTEGVSEQKYSTFKQLTECGDGGTLVYPHVEFSLEFEDDGSVLYNDPLLSSPQKSAVLHQNPSDPFASPFDNEFSGQFFSLLE